MTTTSPVYECVLCLTRAEESAKQMCTGFKSDPSTRKGDVKKHDLILPTKQHDSQTGHWGGRKSQNPNEHQIFPTGPYIRARMHSNKIKKKKTTLMDFYVNNLYSYRAYKHQIPAHTHTHKRAAGWRRAEVMQIWLYQFSVPHCHRTGRSYLGLRGGGWAGQQMWWDGRVGQHKGSPIRCLLDKATGS